MTLSALKQSAEEDFPEADAFGLVDITRGTIAWLIGIEKPETEAVGGSISAIIDLYTHSVSDFEPFQLTFRHHGQLLLVHRNPKSNFAFVLEVGQNARNSNYYRGVLYAYEKLLAEA